jgi:transcriptional regulator of acetoin/glycerol metabolism
VRAARLGLSCGASPIQRSDIQRRFTTVADISVERKPRSPLGLILAIVLLAAIAGAVWWYMSQNGGHPAAAGAPAAPAPATANP